MDLAQGTPNPRPVAARSIGVLNLLVGLSLLLGSGWLAYVMIPFLLENTPLRIDPVAAQEVTDGVRQQLVLDLDAREKQASSAEAKARIREERKTIQSGKSRIADQVDFKKLDGDLSWLSAYLWLDIASGPVLNVLLVVSGLGLIASKRWGRTLAIGTVVLKVVRLGLLGLFLAGWVIPSFRRVLAELGNSDAGRGLLQVSLGQANEMIHTNATLSPSEIVDAMSWAAYGFTVILVGFGAIYPAIVFLVLSQSKPGADPNPS